ncbi:MAG: site-specific integrase [Lachnospiraceae bacterium]|nr:site-specific integrase [Lachnospiraceae bacterium]
MAKKKRLPAGMTRRKDGIIVCRFTVEGRRFAVYAQTAEECRVKELEKRQEIKEGRYKTGKELTVSEYFDRWLENKRVDAKEATLRTYRILMDRMKNTAIDEAGRTFGNLKLVKVEKQNVIDLQRALQKELKTKDEDGNEVTRKGMTTRSTNDAINLLKQVFKDAVDEDIMKKNYAKPVKPIPRTEPRARDTIHRALTKEETTAFLQTAQKEESWYYPLYVFLLNTGCRIGEAGALTPADVMKNGIQISRTITRTEVGGYEIGKDPKTAAGKRYIPLSDDAKKALENQKSVNRFIRGIKVVDLNAPIFTAPNGGLLKSANVNYDIHKICKLAKIEKFSVHAFRDTFATRCVESGMQVKMLQEILGHTDIQMTLGLYAHAMDDQKEEQLKQVKFG